MHSRYPQKLTLKLGVLASLLGGCLGTAGCTSDTADEIGSMEDDLKAGGNPKWIYDGPMPSLKDVSIVVSLKGHTARVTGTLPSTFTGSLPWYAKTATTAGVTKVTVVYPVATGASASNNGPGVYTTIFGLAYVTTTSKAAWGGFPFLEYNAKRGLAFHGPITAKDGEWKLIRGPVSHGCNRMQGEHVVELAKILGIDMGVPHKASEQFTIKAKVSVIQDWDSVDGKYVDVNYPALSTVKRPPAAQSTVFPTWASQDLPRMVCEWNASLWTTDPVKNKTHCNYKPANKFDPLAGPKP
ncbi:MAG: L,D-transpeptidase [Deltaproteobacteria bacterium]|nr:L,D-transpeptidase [Deltaproteobacteria bacterium]